MWNPPDEDECITFEGRMPDECPDSLMKKMHEHDTVGDVQWNKFHHGLQTEENNKRPMDEVIVVDNVK
eukprot:892173-Prorocentrum_lima.AAC.1